MDRNKNYDSVIVHIIDVDRVTHIASLTELSAISQKASSDVRSTFQSMISGIVGFLENNPGALHIGYVYGEGQRDKKTKISTSILLLSGPIAIGEILQAEEIQIH